MPNTTNFNWTTPADTDLVKDGALAIRTLANGIDTSFLDLKGGTTGQVLAKATNTDLDFQWVAQDDSNAIQNAIIDAKGDLIVGTAADTPARLAVGGTNGHVLTVDSAESSGMKWASVPTGGMTLINTGGTTLTGTSVTIGSIPQTYYNLQLIVRDFRPVTDGDQLRLKFNGDGTSNLHYYDTWYSSTGTAAWNRSSVILINDTDNGASDGLCVVDFYDYTNTTTHKVGLSQGMSNNQTTPANIQYFQSRIFYKSTNAITSLELFTDSGSGFTSGTALLYGVK